MLPKLGSQRAVCMAGMVPCGSALISDQRFVAVYGGGSSQDPAMRMG